MLKNYLLIFLAILSLHNCDSSHKSHDQNKEKYFISSKSGLNLRDKPAVNGKVLCTLPFLSTVYKIKQSSSKIIIQGKTGFWFYVQSNSIKGWLYSGFIRKVPNPHSYFFRKISKNMEKIDIRYAERKLKVEGEGQDSIFYRCSLFGEKGVLTYFFISNTISHIDYSIQSDNEVNYLPGERPSKELKKWKQESMNKYHFLKVTLSKKYGKPSSVDQRKKKSGSSNPGGAYFSDELVTEWHLPDKLITLTFSYFIDPTESYRVMIKIFPR